RAPVAGAGRLGQAARGGRWARQPGPSRRCSSVPAAELEHTAESVQDGTNRDSQSRAARRSTRTQRAADCGPAWGLSGFDGKPALLRSTVSVVATVDMALKLEVVMLDNNAHPSASVQARVATELDWDPKVDNSDIAVTAHGGAVTLRGTVSSLRQVREAQHATRRVFGVTSVSNYLQVRSIN